MRTALVALLIVSLALAGPTRAQLGAALWGETLDDQESGAAALAEVPGVGHVLAGRFELSLTLGDVTFTGSGQDVFVTCMDGPGSHVWSRHLTGAEVRDLADAPGGRTVLVGGVYATYDLGAGEVVGTDMHSFLLALDSAGNLEWSSVLGGPGWAPFVAVATNDAGEIYVGGSIVNAVDLGGGVLPFGGDHDALVAKFDSDGMHMWSRAFGGAEYQAILDLAVGSDGKVVVSGWGAGEFDIGLGPVANSSISNDSVLLAAFDTDGTPRFGRWIQSPLAFGNGVACGPDGEVFVTGSYYNWLNFGDVALSAVGSDDIFVAEFTDIGGLVWNRSFGTGTNEERGTNVLSDGDGGMIVSGMFRGTDPIDFGGGPVGAASNWNSAFILFLDGDGAHRSSYGYSYGPTVSNTLIRGQDGAIALAGTITNEPMQPNDGCVDFGSGYLCTYDERGKAFIQTFDPLVPTGVPAPSHTRHVVLHSCRPNPFNPRTTVRFTVAPNRTEIVRLRVFDAVGRSVRLLYDGLAGPGEHDVEWDGLDESSRPVASGTYYCRLDGESGAQSTKLSLLK